MLPSPQLLCGPEPAPLLCPQKLILGHVLHNTLDLWHRVLILPSTLGELETGIQITVSEQVMFLGFSFPICKVGMIIPRRVVGGLYKINHVKWPSPPTPHSRPLEGALGSRAGWKGHSLQKEFIEHIVSRPAHSPCSCGSIPPSSLHIFSCKWKVWTECILSLFCTSLGTSVTMEGSLSF